MNDNHFHAHLITENGVTELNLVVMNSVHLADEIFHRALKNEPLDEYINETFNNMPLEARAIMATNAAIFIARVFAVGVQADQVAYQKPMHEYLDAIKAKFAEETTK